MTRPKGNLLNICSTWAPEAVALLFMFMAAVTFPSLAGDPGVGWHLRAGELMLEQHAVLSRDPFLFPPPEVSWINNQWGSQLVLFALFESGGWYLVHAVSFLVAWGAHLIIPLTLLRQGGVGTTASIGALIAVIALGSPQWIIRPQLISFLFFGITLLLLRTWLVQRDSPRNSTPRVLLPILPPLFLLWANLHPGFFFGFIAFIPPLLISLYLREKPRVFALTSTLLVCAAATLVNPFGLELHLKALELTSDPFFTDLMVEWRPLLESSELSTRFLAVTLVIACGATFALLRHARWRKEHMFDFAILLIVGVMTLEHRRVLGFFAIAAVLPCAVAIQQFVPRQLRGEAKHRIMSLRSIGVLAASMLVLVALVPWGNHLLTPTPSDRLSALSPFFPTTLIAKLEEHSKQTTPSGSIRVFNDPNLGGPIIWATRPQIRIFADDRNEVNGRARYEHYHSLRDGSANEVKWLYDSSFNYVLIPSRSRLVQALKDQPGADLIAYDSDHHLFHLGVLGSQETPSEIRR